MRAAIGYLRGPLNWPERIVVTAAAALLVAAVPLTDEAGFAASAAFRRLALVPHAREAAPSPAASIERARDAVDAICLLVAGVVRATLPAPEFTLAWDHSVAEDRAGRSATASMETAWC